jgi:hypothetical protein
MRARSGAIVLGLGALLALSGPVAAQQAHVVSSSEIDRAVRRKATPAAADRAALRRLLARPEASHLANRYGLDLQRARDAVATLDGAELAELGARARRIDAGLAGGNDTIVISTTTLIIALLVLIIILVA